MSGAAGGNGAWHDDLAPAWDAVAASRPAIIRHVTGEAVDYSLGLAEVVGAFHAASVALHAPIYPGLLVQRFAIYPQSAYADRILHGHDGFVADVTGVWQECIDALRARFAGWPEPVDILADTTGTAPILTERHLPPALWPFVRDTAERMGVATSSVALSAVVACSSAISEDWEIQPKQNDYRWKEQSRLWGAIVGPPSILKSPVIAETTAPVVALNMVAHTAWMDAMAVHKVAMAAWKDGGRVGPEPEPPRKARHLVESITVEAMQEVLRDDPNGKMYAPLGKVLARHDELAEFLANMDKYSQGGGGGDRGAWLRAYNGGPYVVDRIGRGSFVTKSWSCCLLGGIQPEPIQRIANKADNDGLIQRFMFDVPSDQGQGLDRTPHGDALAAYRDLFPALASLRPARSGDANDRHVTVVFHRDAHPIREDINALAFAMARMPDASPRLQSAFGKWPGLFARLCLTFHLIELAAARARNEIGPHPDVITADTAKLVQNYMRGILAPHLMRADALMFMTRQSGHAEWIAGHILAHRLDRITARQIAKSYHPLRPPEERRTLDDTMLNLCMTGWVEDEESSNASKAPTAWKVNPRVHVAYALRAEAERKRREEVRAALAAHWASLRPGAAHAV